MRLLVISDSHGMRRRIEDLIELHPEADAIVFLGDGERDIIPLKEFYPERRFICVAGNCDFASRHPDSVTELIGGKRIFCTHGHLYNAKSGEANLRAAARKAGADILLYGHTHTPVTAYDDGLYIMNPGTLMMSQYGMVDITPGGILCTTARMP